MKMTGSRTTVRVIIKDLLIKKCYITFINGMYVMRFLTSNMCFPFDSFFYFFVSEHVQMMCSASTSYFFLVLVVFLHLGSVMMMW
jgi:hypothetical protein